MKKIKIYIDGDSEKTYLQKLRIYFGEKHNITGSKIQFDRLEIISGGVNPKIIDVAIKKYIANESRDFVFFITDREENVDRIRILDETEKYLKNQKEKYKSKIKILVSNPTFEMWLYLHFKESNLKIFTQKQLMDNLSLITNYQYKKADLDWLNTNIFKKEKDLIEVASRNARLCKEKNKLNQDKEYQFSESNIFELINYIESNK